MKLITPEQLAISGREDSEQTALFCWCALTLKQYPEFKWLFHVPNGGYRNKREAGKFKAMGVKAGVLDLWFPVKRGIYPGLIIELKQIKFKSSKDSEMSSFLLSDHISILAPLKWLL